MEWLSLEWEDIVGWLPALIAILNLIITSATLAWVLMTKSNSTSAVAWCLLVIFLPFLGALIFFLFGYQHVNRPLKRKRRHKQKYQLPPYPTKEALAAAGGPANTVVEMPDVSLNESLAKLANRFGAYPLTTGNRIDFYWDGPPAFDAMLEAIRAAKHHIHLEFFIFHGDGIGCQFLDEMTQKAKEGVQVRLLYDAMGSVRLPAKCLKPLKQAGGKISQFLPLNPFRRRLQVNMRNHRKVLIVDGDVAFMGGLNIGDEYLGKLPRFGYWRDTHLRIEGPAVGDLQRVFSEDWDFAAKEKLSDQGTKADQAHYFRPKEVDGSYAVQVIDSGPDRDLKAIREIYFAAILKARKRLWIASPYFVPDAGLLDALRFAGYQGVDVRFLGQLHPDKFIPQFAARYYWDEMLKAGVKIYQYAKGMMHSKVILVDDSWASVGTANLDNRSLYLNFEVNCLIYSPEAVKILEQSFDNDLCHSIRLDRGVFSRRPFAGRLLENACRLLSPVL
jgi:cardiolipin synthase